MLADDVSIEIDANDDVGPECAANADRYRVDQPTIDEPAIVITYRREQPRHRHRCLQAADEAGVLRPDVEKAEHVRTGRAQHPFPEHIQASRYIRGTNHRADGRAADDVGLETGIDQRVDHADVRPAA